MFTEDLLGCDKDEWLCNRRDRDKETEIQSRVDFPLNYHNGSTTGYRNLELPRNKILEVDYPILFWTLDSSQGMEPCDFMPATWRVLPWSTAAFFDVILSTRSVHGAVASFSIMFHASKVDLLHSTYSHQLTCTFDSTWSCACNITTTFFCDMCWGQSCEMCKCTEWPCLSLWCDEIWRNMGGALFTCAGCILSVLIDRNGCDQQNTFNICRVNTLRTAWIYVLTKVKHLTNTR